VVIQGHKLRNVGFGSGVNVYDHAHVSGFQLFAMVSVYVGGEHYLFVFYKQCFVNLQGML